MNNKKLLIMYIMNSTKWYPSIILLSIFMTIYLISNIISFFEVVLNIRMEDDSIRQFIVFRIKSISIGVFVFHYIFVKIITMVIDKEKYTSTRYERILKICLYQFFFKYLRKSTLIQTLFNIRLAFYFEMGVAMYLLALYEEYEEVSDKSYPPGAILATNLLLYIPAFFA